MKMDSFDQVLMPHGRSIHLQLLFLTSGTSLLSNFGSVGGCDVIVMIFKQRLKKKWKRSC